MSRRHFSLLAVAAVVVGLIVLLMPSRTGQEDPGNPRTGSQSAGELLLPGLTERINEAESLRVTGAGGQTLATLERVDDVWRIVELSGYPADFGRLRAVLAGLAQTEIIEPKTGNPEYYSRLGVEDVASPDAGGLLLTVTAAGEQSAVIVGDPASSRGGRYLRVAGEAGSVLADFEAEVPENAVGWADDAIVDLPAPMVADVVIEHADGERLRISKGSADDTDYTLEGGVPEGRELVSSWSVNSLGGVFAALSLEDVRRAETIDWSNATRVAAIGFSGLRLEATLVERENTYWLHLSASAPDAESAPPVTGEAPDPQQDGDVQDPAVLARDINDRAAGWAYAIPSFKAETMGRRLEDLLSPPADATAEP